MTNEQPPLNSLRANRVKLAWRNARNTLGFEGIMNGATGLMGTFIAPMVCFLSNNLTEAALAMAITGGGVVWSTRNLNRSHNQHIRNIAGDIVPGYAARNALPQVDGSLRGFTKFTLALGIGLGIGLSGYVVMPLLKPKQDMFLFDAAAAGICLIAGYGIVRETRAIRRVIYLPQVAPPSPPV